MATFSKISALSTRKYVSEYGMSIPDLSNKLRVFQSHSSVTASEKQRYNRNFQSFLALKYLLVASFKERCALTSRKYLPKPGESIPD